MGRGSSGLSQTSGWKSQIPKASEFEIRESLPQLSGTEKQIKWAEDIRNSMVNELIDYAISRDSEGRVSGLYDIAVEGRKAIISDIESNPLVNTTSGAVQQEKLNSSVAGYQDLARRIQAVNEILSHESAKYWIDNRTNQRANYMNKKLKGKIDGK